MTATATPADVLHLINGSKLLAVDLETCGPPGQPGGLNPRRDRVRLLSIANQHTALVMDCFEHDLRQVLPSLQGKILCCHNAAFDLGFLWHLGLRDLPEVICTQLLAILLTAGERERVLDGTGLAACCQRWLGKPLNKELQTSDWSGPLSADQVEYSRQDAAVLIPLLQVMTAEIETAGLLGASEIEMQCLPAWVWLCQSGVAFDRDSWLKLAETAQARKADLASRLDELAPMKGPPGLFGPVESWNWDSPQQVAEVFRHLGSPLGIYHKGRQVETTNTAALALSDEPLAALLRNYRHQAQLLKMFGPKWLASADLQNGRLYPGWRQIGAASGRTSCEKPNCQQIPRDPGYRACFTAAPGRVLVKADYATLQMRIACNQAQDHAMLAVFQAEAAGGPDVHTATARLLLGKSNITRPDRQIAKSAGFGLLFGMSAEGLRLYARMTYGVEFGAAEAAQHRDTWLRSYPGIAAWHKRAAQDRSREARSRLGRRRLLYPDTPATQRLNTPVQADESNLAKMALGTLWRRRAEVPSVKLVLFAHDEIVVEVDEVEAEIALRWLTESMQEAGSKVLEPVPCAVEGRTCKTWAG